MIANEPDIIAWLAIIAAETAIMKVGQNSGPANKIQLCFIQAKIKLRCNIIFNNLPGIDL
jgi:hypothetical protein